MGPVPVPTQDDLPTDNQATLSTMRRKSTRCAQGNTIETLGTMAMTSPSKLFRNCSNLPWSPVILISKRWTLYFIHYTPSKQYAVPVLSHALRVISQPDFLSDKDSVRGDVRTAVTLIHTLSMGFDILLPSILAVLSMRHALLATRRNP